MNKNLIISLSFWLVCVCLLCTLLFTACREPSDEYLRLHIRANGNTSEEQQIKLQVRDAVVAYLTPLAKGVHSKQEMQTLLSNHMNEVVAVADGVLREAGCAYTAHAYMGTEAFPQKTYGDLTLPAGEYDALVVELGTGQGENWWCVAFPPLCFVAAEDVAGDEIHFRSAIAEWFRQNCR